MEFETSLLLIFGLIIHYYFYALRGFETNYLKIIIKIADMKDSKL